MTLEIVLDLLDYSNGVQVLRMLKYIHAREVSLLGLLKAAPRPSEIEKDS